VLPATVGEALDWAVRTLREAGVDSPRLTAEVLLAHILNRERSRLIGRPDDALSAGDLQKYKSLALRRASGEPLHYLTGEREFYGLSFKVSPSVLIPRPETEFLVERALALAGGRAVRFADVGTGSGCIAVTLVCEQPQARGWGTDISLEALAVARENACRHGTGDRLGLAQCDLLDCFPKRQIFDLILSNPPYVSGPEMRRLSPMVREHEPGLALTGGETGLDVYRRLIPEAGARLTTNGFLMLEAGAGQAAEVSSMIRQENLALVEIIDDLQGIPRCIVAQRRH